MKEKGKELQDILIREKLPGFDRRNTNVVDHASRGMLDDSRTGVEAGRRSVEETALKIGDYTTNTTLYCHLNTQLPLINYMLLYVHTSAHTSQGTAVAIYLVHRDCYGICILPIH